MNWRKVNERGDERLVLDILWSGGKKSELFKPNVIREGEKPLFLAACITHKHTQFYKSENLF